MNRFVVAALSIAFVAAPALAQDGAPAAAALPATKGKMLIAADGARLAPVFRVAGDGPQVILDGRMVTVPASTIAMVGGKVMTSLTKAQVIALP